MLDWWTLETSDVKEWTSHRVVNIVDVTGGFLGVPGVGNVSWVKPHRFISSCGPCH